MTLGGISMAKGGVVEAWIAALKSDVNFEGIFRGEGICGKEVIRYNISLTFNVEVKTFLEDMIISSCDVGMKFWDLENTEKHFNSESTLFSILGDEQYYFPFIIYQDMLLYHLRLTSLVGKHSFVSVANSQLLAHHKYTRNIAYSISQILKLNIYPF
jgi:hypothetical protein